MPARRSAAELVVLSDRLPGLDPTTGVTVGGNGLPDDPTSTALSWASTRPGALWVGRPPPGLPQTRSATVRELVVAEAVGAGHEAGYCRQTLWPHYHELVRPARHDPDWFRQHRAVNQQFAAAAAESAAPGGTVLVYGHQLQLVPGLLRRLRRDLRIGFCFDVPFPGPAVFRLLPDHARLRAGLLAADLVGFETTQSAENFTRLSSPDHADPDRARSTRVGVYRRSVDTRAIATLAARPDTLARAAAIRDRLGRPRSVLLSLDTDDDMEAAHRRLAALSTLYSEHGCRPEDVSVIQVMTCAARPGATDGTGAVAREVARINGLYGAVGRTPVHYLQSAPDLAERVALYLAADLLVATPLRQVTSLAALEYVAAGPPTGGLVLSEFGATAQVLPGAWMVNPFQPHEVATTIRAATAAAPDERRCRIAAMRRYVAGYDHRIWLETFAGAVRRRSGGTDAPTRRAADRPSRRPASAILTAGPR